MSRAVPIIALVAIVLFSGSLFSQTEQLDGWRDTLRFGIDSEVEGIIPDLERSGSAALDDALLLRFQRSRSEDLQTQIIEYFERTGSDLLVEEVRRTLLEDTPSESIMRASASYLTAMSAGSDAEIVAVYGEFAEDGSLLTRTIAIEAIGRSQSPDAVEVLTELYEDQSNEDVRASILRALGMTGSDEAIPQLSQIAEDEFEQSALRHYATESLGRIGAEESLPLLEELLTDSDSILRAYATVALGSYPTERTGAALEAALLDSFWRVRVAALQALSAQQTVEAIPAVAYKAQNDPERPVRAAAVETLGALATPEAIDVLAEIASDRRANEADRISAIGYLIEKSGAASNDLLLEIVADEWEREGSRVLDAIGRGLSVHAKPGSLPLLQRLLDHPNFIIRVYGIRGVGSAGIRAEIERLKQIAVANEGLLRTTAVNSLSEMGITFDPQAEEPDDEADTPSASETQ